MLYFLMPKQPPVSTIFYSYIMLFRDSNAPFLHYFCILLYYVTIMLHYYTAI